MPSYVNNELQTHEALRTVWRILLEIVLKHGPFTVKDKKGELSPMVDTACVLSPDGPRPQGCCWLRSQYCSVADYSDFTRCLFATKRWIAQ